MSWVLGICIMSWQVSITTVCARDHTIRSATAGMDMKAGSHSRRSDWCWLLFFELRVIRSQHLDDLCVVGLRSNGYSQVMSTPWGQVT